MTAQLGEYAARLVLSIVLAGFVLSTIVECWRCRYGTRRHTDPDEVSHDRLMRELDRYR